MKKLNRRISALAILGCLHACSSKEEEVADGLGTVLLLEPFAEGLPGPEWRMKNQAWEILDPVQTAALGLAAGDYWQSPPFEVKPLGYYKIEVSSTGKGRPFLCGMGFNVDAAWGRFPHPAATSGELVATDWNSWEAEPADGVWSQRTYFTRARVNALKCGVQLMGDGVRFRDLKVTLTDREEVLDWADGILASEMAPLEWTPEGTPANVCPRSRKILADRGTLRIVMLGDSIMNDLGNSSADLLLERAFPGSRVEIITAVGGGTGAGAWLRDEETRWPSKDLDLNAAAVQTRPDLVMIGGISNGLRGLGDIRGLIDKLQKAGVAASVQEPEILLLTGAFGSVPDPPGYADGLRTLAEELQCGFLDLRAVTDAYFGKAATAGYSKDHFYRDPVHANHRGKQLMGRILLRFFESH